MSDTVISSPVIDELRRKVKELRKAIRAIVDEWFLLQNEVRPRLLAEYDRHFREIEIEIQQKTLESSEIGRRVELLSLKKERGETLTSQIITLVNTLVDKEFAQFHKRIYEAYSLTEDERRQRAAIENEANKDNELPKLYRAIVKKLHPDVSDSNDNFSKFWHSVQEAFENKNIQKMRSLYTLLCGDEDNIHTKNYPNSFSEEMKLQAEIKELEIHLERENRKCNRLKNEEPFSIEHNLTNAEWRRVHLQKLEHELHKKYAEIKQFTLLYEQLTGTEWKQTPSIQQQEQQNFEQEFTNSTYFSGR
jgi:hypothetical protein